MFEKPEILWQKTEKEIEACPDDVIGPNVVDDGTTAILTKQHRRWCKRFQKL
jgi:hypothetical protein